MENPRENAVFICAHVFENIKPTLLIVHDWNGDWGMYCGGTHEDGNIKVVGINHMFTQDESLLKILELKNGTEAERKTIHDEWVVSDLPPEEEPPPQIEEKKEKIKIPASEKINLKHVSPIRKKTIEYLKSKGIEYTINVPEKEYVRIRELDSILDRIIQIIALKFLSGEKPKDEKWKKWLHILNLFDSLAEKEKGFFERGSKNLKEKELMALSWSGEGLFTLGWAASIVEEFSFPDDQGDLDNFYPNIVNSDFKEKIFPKKKLRTKEEIFEQLDFYYCLYRLDIDTNALAGKRIPFLVIKYRLIALEWLAGKENWWEILPE